MQNPNYAQWLGNLELGCHINKDANLDVLFNLLPKLEIKKENKEYCVYCYQVAKFKRECEMKEIMSPETPMGWRNHLVKDKHGYNTCPVLARCICPKCGLTGKYGHTKRYCAVYVKLAKKDKVFPVI